eukprot:3676215-Rhodomonas_salina.1
MCVWDYAAVSGLLGVVCAWRAHGDSVVMSGIGIDVAMCVWRAQVIVKRLSSGTRIVLKSHFGYEILKINIYQVGPERARCAVCGAARCCVLS